MIKNILSITAGLMYAVLGAFVAYYQKFMSFELQPNVAIALGALLVIYGLFRIYRSLFLNKNKAND
jgi:uncharacterized membrane protein